MNGRERGMHMIENEIFLRRSFVSRTLLLTSLVATHDVVHSDTKY
jgi:hypothetical protein